MRNHTRTLSHKFNQLCIHLHPCWIRHPSMYHSHFYISLLIFSLITCTLYMWQLYSFPDMLVSALYHSVCFAELISSCPSWLRDACSSQVAFAKDLQSSDWAYCIVAHVFSHLFTRDSACGSDRWLLTNWSILFPPSPHQVCGARHWLSSLKVCGRIFQSSIEPKQPFNIYPL